MKKILFGTTALLAAGAFASAAQASDPIKLQLGGYMEYWVAGANQDDDSNLSVNSFDIQGESEVWFVGKTTLDNGMVIGVQVELEAGSNNNGDDTVDESYMFLEGKYGKAIIGSENDAAYLLHVNAPNASDMGGAYVTSEADTVQYLPTGGATGLDAIPNTLSDNNKFTYFTPKFYGFQAGVSYVPSNTQNGDDQTVTAINGVTNSESIVKAMTFDEAWAFGAAYSAEFSGIGVKASAHYVTMDMNHTVGGGDVQEFGGGLNLSYQGFTVGGAAKRKVASADTGAAQAATDGFAWNAGVMYAEGPYKVSLNYATSTTEGTSRASGSGHDEIDVWRLGGAYALGPGVNVFAELAYSDANDADTGAGTVDNKGAYGGVVGLHLNF